MIIMVDVYFSLGFKSTLKDIFITMACAGIDYIGEPCKIRSLPGKVFCLYHQQLFDQEERLRKKIPEEEEKPPPIEEKVKELEEVVPNPLSESAKKLADELELELESKKIECPICVDKYLPRIKCPSCKQFIHKKCVISWGETKCPFCKVDINDLQALELTQSEIEGMRASKKKNHFDDEGIPPEFLEEGLAAEFFMALDEFFQS